MPDAGMSRPCAWGDIPRTHDLAARAYLANPAGPSRIGEFWWALRATPDGDPLSGMRLWLSDNTPVAAAWLDPPNSSDLIVAPAAHEGLLSEAIDWLESETRLAGGEALAIIAHEGDQARADELRRRGYAPSEAGNIRFRRNLSSMPDAVALPDGYSLRHLATDRDIEPRVHVEAASFEGSTTTIDVWRLLRERLPNYRPSLDLFVLAPAGTGASACTCWYDTVAHRGEFEAVGTTPKFQRRGLGKAVIVEGLRRLHECGATEAVLYTSIGNTAAVALYESCGFAAVGQDFAWTKRLSP